MLGITSAICRNRRIPVRASPSCRRTSSEYRRTGSVPPHITPRPRPIMSRRRTIIRRQPGYAVKKTMPALLTRPRWRIVTRIIRFFTMTKRRCTIPNITENPGKALKSHSGLSRPGAHQPSRRGRAGGGLHLPYARANPASGPGNCPICGMTLEPMEVSAAAEPNHELADMTRRFWVGLVLNSPVFILEMGGHIPGLRLHDLCRPRAPPGHSSPYRHRLSCGMDSTRWWWTRPARGPRASRR